MEREERGRRYLLLGVCALALPACYSPDFSGTGSFFCDDGRCPEGFSCDATQPRPTCVREGGAPLDSAIVDARRVLDAALPDAQVTPDQTVVPRLCRFEGEAVIAEGVAPEGSIGVTTDQTSKGVFVSHSSDDDPPRLSLSRCCRPTVGWEVVWDRGDRQWLPFSAVDSVGDRWAVVYPDEQGLPTLAVPDPNGGSDAVTRTALADETGGSSVAEVGIAHSGGLADQLHVVYRSVDGNTVHFLRAKRSTGQAQQDAWRKTLPAPENQQQFGAHLVVDTDALANTYAAFYAFTPDETVVLHRATLGSTSSAQWTTKPLEELGPAPALPPLGMDMINYWGGNVLTPVLAEDQARLRLYFFVETTPPADITAGGALILGAAHPAAVRTDDGRFALLFVGEGGRLHLTWGRDDLGGAVAPIDVPETGGDREVSTTGLELVAVRDDGFSALAIYRRRDPTAGQVLVSRPVECQLSQ